MYICIDSAGNNLNLLMKKIIIGREEEQKMLAEIALANAADMLAITGRRRVGKTYLINAFFEDHLNFEFSGILNASNEQHLQSFSIALAKQSGKRKPKLPPANWMEAFDQLIIYRERLKKTKKLLVFIDELVKTTLDVPQATVLSVEKLAILPVNVLVPPKAILKPVPPS